jgi:hypothetical protein
MHIIQDDPVTTIPMAYSPEWYEKQKAAHAASEITDDDGVQFMGRLLVFAALMTAVAATLVVVML